MSIILFSNDNLLSKYSGFTLDLHVSAHPSYVHLSGFCFRMITSKCHSTCIDILKIWFGIASGQISSIFDSYLPATR